MISYVMDFVRLVDWCRLVQGTRCNARLVGAWRLKMLELCDPLDPQNIRIATRWCELACKRDRRTSNLMTLLGHGRSSQGKKEHCRTCRDGSDTVGTGTFGAGPETAGTMD